MQTIEANTREAYNLFHEGTLVLSKAHRKKMNYSSKLDTIIKKELSKLIEKAKKKSSPFKHEEIEEYYKLYKKLKGKR